MDPDNRHLCKYPGFRRLELSKSPRRLSGSVSASRAQSSFMGHHLPLSCLNCLPVLSESQPRPKRDSAPWDLAKLDICVFGACFLGNSLWNPAKSSLHLFCFVFSFKKRVSTRTMQVSRVRGRARVDLVWVSLSLRSCAISGK